MNGYFLQQYSHVSMRQPCNWLLVLSLGMSRTEGVEQLKSHFLILRTIRFPSNSGLRSNEKRSQKKVWFPEAIGEPAPLINGVAISQTAKLVQFSSITFPFLKTTKKRKNLSWTLLQLHFRFVCPRLTILLPFTVIPGKGFDTFYIGNVFLRPVNEPIAVCPLQQPGKHSWLWETFFSIPVTGMPDWSPQMKWKHYFHLRQNMFSASDGDGKALGRISAGCMTKEPLRAGSYRRILGGRTGTKFIFPRN